VKSILKRCRHHGPVLGGCRRPPRITSTTEPRPELIYTFWVSVPVISARMRLIMSFVRSASLIALVAAERALVEADIGRYKRVIGDALRSRTEGWQTT
jgi:hypothetical protein